MRIARLDIYKRSKNRDIRMRDKETKKNHTAQCTDVHDGVCFL